MNRTLTITIDPDWRQQLRDAGALAEAGIASGQYQGEYLNFATPALLWSRITESRWEIVSSLLGQGEVSEEELALRLKRDLAQVHEDSEVLLELGLLEKTESGDLCCPYQRIHVEMTLTPPLLAKAA